MAKYKTVKVPVPEIGELAVDPESLSQLDSLCAEIRSLNEQIGELEKGNPERGIRGKNEAAVKLKELANGLHLPNRVLGDMWDLRKTVRTTEKINTDRLKSLLLRADLKLEIECQPVAFVADPEQPSAIMAVVCPKCQGSGTRLLEGLEAINALVEMSTDRSESVSWSVYGRDKEKEGQDAG